MVRSSRMEISHETGLLLGMSLKGIHHQSEARAIQSFNEKFLLTRRVFNITPLRACPAYMDGHLVLYFLKMLTILLLSMILGLCLNISRTSLSIHKSCIRIKK